MSAVMRQIQQSVADRLAAMPEFAHVAVVPEDVMDLDTKVATALGKMGVCVVVVTARATQSYTDTPQPYFQAVTVAVQVFERVAVNRRLANPGYLTGQNYAELASAYLHGWAPDGVNEVFVAQDVVMARLPQDAADAGIVGWEAPVRTQGGFQVSVPQVAPVVIDVAQQPVTMTCATPGAAIWFTTDGSYPAPRGPTATLYLLSFWATGGDKIHAQAYLAGYLPSGVAVEDFSESGAWIYLGQGLRYNADFLQVAGVNESAFHTITCRSPQGYPSVFLGAAVAETGGNPVTGYVAMGANCRYGTAGLQLWCADTALWHPLLTVPLFGQPTLTFADGIADAAGTATGQTISLGSETKVDDVGFKLYNADEARWYLLQPASLFGNVQPKLTPTT